MKTVDLEAWRAKNMRLNENVQLSLGMQVRDADGGIGVVVRIISPEDTNSVVDHGTVYVWQRDRFDYGSDNCEHYCLTNWHSFLRIIE